jgi:hypothetical protein
MRECVRQYLGHVGALCHVEPPLVRRVIAEACHDELAKFSATIRHLLGRKRRSREGVEEVLNRDCFDHIPIKFRRVGSRSGRRSDSSHRHEKATLARLTWFYKESSGEDLNSPDERSSDSSDGDDNS